MAVHMTMEPCDSAAADTALYPLHYLSAGKKRPCRIVSVKRNKATVREPDPYDTGEVEFTLPIDQIVFDLGGPVTHTFVHSSMFGSYTTECRATRLDERVSVIKFINTFAWEVCEMTIATKDLTPIDFDPVVEAFEKAMVGRQYGEDERMNALGWFRAGWEASRV